LNNNNNNNKGLPVQGTGQIGQTELAGGIVAVAVGLRNLVEEFDLDCNILLDQGILEAVAVHGIPVVAAVAAAGEIPERHNLAATQILEQRNHLAFDFLGRNSLVAAAAAAAEQDIHLPEQGMSGCCYIPLVQGSLDSGNLGLDNLLIIDNGKNGGRKTKTKNLKKDVTYQSQIDSV
jgi:hypothetical protein